MKTNLRVLGVGLILTLLGTTAAAQTNALNEYAVKFICGKGDGKVLASGVYLTAINIHNPTDTTAIFRYKIALTPYGTRPAGRSPFFDGRLESDDAIEIDCTDQNLAKYFAKMQITGFKKGFLVIQSPSELDVVAIYSAAGSTKYVETMDVERIVPRRITK